MQSRRTSDKGEVRDWSVTAVCQTAVTNERLGILGVRLVLGGMCTLVINCCVLLLCKEGSGAFCFVVFKLCFSGLRLIRNSCVFWNEMALKATSMASKLESIVEVYESVILMWLELWPLFSTSEGKLQRHAMALRGSRNLWHLIAAWQSVYYSLKKLEILIG